MINLRPTLPSLFLKILDLVVHETSQGNPHNLLSSFTKGIASPLSPDLPFGFYVYLLDLTCAAASSTLLALYQISFRGRERIATPLPPSQPRGFRLVVHYTVSV